MEKSGNQILPAIVLCRFREYCPLPRTSHKNKRAKTQFCETLYWILGCIRGNHTNYDFWRVLLFYSNGSFVYSERTCVWKIRGGGRMGTIFSAVKLPMCSLHIDTYIYSHTFSPYHHNKITYWLYMLYRFVVINIILCGTRKSYWILLTQTPKIHSWKTNG